MRKMSFAVARMTKLKADNLVGIGNHDQRKTTNHSNEDIDVSRSHLNYDLVAGRTDNFKTDIEAYINENKASKRAVRKDAVLVNEWILTSDKDFFEQLDEAETRKYFETAKQYFADNYGDENIRYAVVHMDEKTPHMHMGIVPFDDEKNSQPSVYSIVKPYSVFKKNYHSISKRMALMLNVATKTKSVKIYQYPNTKLCGKI